MQYQTDHSILPDTLSRKDRLHLEIIQLFSSPLFLCLTVCFSLAQIISLFTLSDRNPVASLVSILTDWGIYDSLIMEPLANLSNSIQSAQLFILVPFILITAGLWIIILNAKKDGDNRWYRIGFTTIQVVLFNQLIIALFLVPIASIKVWSILNAIAELAEYVNMQEIIRWITVGKVFLVPAALGTIYFMFRVLITFSVMKESVCESAVIEQSSLYVPFLCFILGGISLLLQIKFGFDLVSVLNCATAILFGIYLLHYKKKIITIQQIS